MRKIRIITFVCVCAARLREKLEADPGQAVRSSLTEPGIRLSPGRKGVTRRGSGRLIFFSFYQKLINACTYT